MSRRDTVVDQRQKIFWTLLFESSVLEILLVQKLSLCWGYTAIQWTISGAKLFEKSFNFFVIPPWVTLLWKKITKVSRHCSFRDQQKVLLGVTCFLYKKHSWPRSFQILRVFFLEEHRKIVLSFVVRIVRGFEMIQFELRRHNCKKDRQFANATPIGI